MDFDALVREAADHLEQHAYGAARAKYARVRELHPQRPEGLLGLGEVAYAGGAYDEAVVLFDEAGTTFSSLPTALVRKAESLAELMRPEEAAAVLLRLRGEKPDCAEADFGYARVLFQSGSIIRALEQWDAALSAHKRDAEGISGKALALLALGRTSQAAELLTPIADTPSGLEGLARVALRERRFSDALDYCNRWMERYPNDLEGWQLKIATLGNVKPADAWRTIETLQERFPEAPAGYIAAASLHQSRERYDDAAREWERMRDIVPSFMRASCNLAHIMMLRGRFEEAETLLVSYTSLHPDDPLGHLRLAQLLSRQQRHNDAFAVYDTALKRIPNNGALLGGEAWAAAFTGKMSAAVKWMDARLAETPDAVAVLRARVLLARASCAFSEASRHAERWYTSVAPTEEACRLWVEALAAAGRGERALHVAREHLSNDPYARTVALSLLRILQQARAWQELLQEAERILSKQPTLSGAVAFKALALAHLGSVIEAHEFLSSQRRRPRRHVLITGTGRAGTTALVQILTELGMQTGYDVDSARALVFSNCNAGLEHDIFSVGAPFIVKDPEVADRIGEVVASAAFVLDHVFIPIRDINEAAASRIAVQEASAYADMVVVPGGLVRSPKAEDAKSVLLERLVGLVQHLELFEVPYTFIQFPRFVRDPDYLYRKLLPLIGNSFTYDQFKGAYDAVVDARKVHDFSHLCGRTPSG